jgi:hypothetical protein
VPKTYPKYIEPCEEDDDYSDCASKVTFGGFHVFAYLPPQSGKRKVQYHLPDTIEPSQELSQPYKEQEVIEKVIPKKPVAVPVTSEPFSYKTTIEPFPFDSKYPHVIRLYRHIMKELHIKYSLKNLKFWLSGRH